MTIPNAICFFRLFASPVLAYLAYRDHATAFVWLFAVLFFSDWIDGKLAILLDQRTTFGARLDSAADAALWAALLLGAYWLKWDVIRDEAAWLLAGVASYVAHNIVGLMKFGRLPSHHTRAAKTCWLLNGIATYSVFAGGPVWPIRVAAAFVVLTNIENILITLVLPAWRADVTSIYHALRRAPAPQEPTHGEREHADQDERRDQRR